MFYNVEDQSLGVQVKAYIGALEKAIQHAVIDLEDFASPTGDFAPTPPALLAVANELRKAIDRPRSERVRRAVLGI
jgi:hypothetical protein